jgi:hypothetical protein
MIPMLYQLSYAAMCNGVDNRTRTCDPVVNSHLLYQLSYVDTKKSRRRDSNPVLQLGRLGQQPIYHACKNLVA